MIQAGLSHWQVGIALHLDHRIIERLLDRYIQTGTVTDRSRTGRHLSNMLETIRISPNIVHYVNVS